MICNSQLLFQAFSFALKVGDLRVCFPDVEVNFILFIFNVSVAKVIIAVFSQVKVIIRFGFYSFLRVWIESIEGKFPLWINPLQGMILNINQEVEDYCNKIHKMFKDEGFRIEKDLTNETLNYKIREYSMQKVPFLIIVGNKEKEENRITIRTLGEEKQISMSLDEFIFKLKRKVESKADGFDL